MNDRDGVGERPDSPATDDDARLGARLGVLGDELAAKRRDSDEKDRALNKSRSREQGQAQALRLATELVAGTLVGAAIGWFFDGWLGTSPWGLIVFLLLGFTAGVLNAVRGAGLVREAPAKLPTADDDEGLSS